MYYYVNKNAQTNGDHEVHIKSCRYFPDAKNIISLGDFSNCRDAVREAKKYYIQVNGCFYCVRECNTD